MARFIVQTVFFAIGQMWSNKVRSLLTTLGIIIGVWAITTVVAAVGGLKGFVLKEFEKFGANKIFIWGNIPDNLRDKMKWEDVRLTESESDLLREKATTLDKVTMDTGMRATVRYRDKSKAGVEVTGIQSDWHEIEQRFVTSGRPLTTNDEDEGLQVCLVNKQAITELALDSGGTGEYIFLNGRRFLIVGIVEDKEMSRMFGGGESQAEVLIPYSTFSKMRSFRWTQITARMKSPELSDEATQEIRYLLRRHRDLPPEWEDTFRIFVLQKEMEGFTKVADAMTMGAAVVVGISLIVGGIGIMNIMLVSVSERTREIGLRKALGARPVVIMMQFLIEAVMLCLSGGLVGLILGQASTLAIQNIPNFPMKEAEIPPWALFLAFFFSAGVGVVFGMWPAVKASRLDPIEALRHE
ncbi:MAG TPA: ABC transporter permease [Phycisphaerales bacterium]|nr:ABC transporter permease [Phycisphaerales bacterium]